MGTVDFEPVKWARIAGLRSADAFKCAECQHRRFLPVIDDVIRWHLSDEDEHHQPFVAGVYPLLLDESCYLLAADFDKANWQDNAVNPGLRSRLLRLAAFQNPEFYKAQAMRRSTYDKPRVIACAEDHPQHIGLPRGCLDERRHTLQDLGPRLSVRDERHAGQPLDMIFQGELRREQQVAADVVLAHDTGVLAATTALGKTVVGAWLIARRGVSALAPSHVGSIRALSGSA